MHEFGKWTFNPSNLTITLNDPEVYEYEIDLETITNSAQMLDWIFQIKKKTWVTHEIMFDLLTALNVLLDPQCNYCSWGENYTVCVADIKPEMLSAVNDLRLL